jgi:biopolymer transport protein TolR
MGLLANKHSGKIQHHYHPMAEINVTPMVDIMLVLLVIFMITSPMLVAGVKVDLPKSSAQPITTSEEPLSITVKKNGDIFIHESKISFAELVPKLVAITNEKKDTRIYVRGDKNLDYGSIMKVVGAINQSGFNKVALVTEIEDTQNKRR